MCTPAGPIEFVPKSDSQVKRLLNRPGFEAAFARHFPIRTVRWVEESERVLYLMARVEADA